MIISPDSDFNILEYIPQRDPIVMVDRLLKVDADSIISSFLIKDSCIFCIENQLSESGLIENIAQTAAAGLGYLDKQNNKEVSIGFIATIKKLQIQSLPSVNSTIITEIKIKEPVMGFSMVSGSIIVGEILIVTCDMVIFVEA